MGIVSKQATKELVKALHERYVRGSKKERGTILDEFTKVSGYHRKHAIRLLGKPAERMERTVVSRRIYDEAVKEALIVIWEAADRICGKRLKAALPNFLEAMEKHGHLQLKPEIREKILSVSAATIDRVLMPVRSVAGTHRRKPRIMKVRRGIEIKKFQDWQDPLPGYMEIDFVVHGGGSMSGVYIHSLVATDVSSGWTEAVPLLAREQSLVVEGLKRIRNQMPVPLLGIDSDNDGAFINETLANYCEREKITFTRSRPHHKNDQAWIEQKNGAVIRKTVGHERFSGIVAGQAMAHLFEAMRLHVNYFQPSFKLRERSKDGSKITKRYYPPVTPCDRLIVHKAVDESVKEALRLTRNQLDPVELLHRIRQGQSALAALSTGEPSSGPNRESLVQFLAQLPQLWQLGEARPTHRKGAAQERYWRTRVDPFKNVWSDILLWLQKDPDCTAKSLFERLQEKHPTQFEAGQLRTLQRRIGEWRQTMARKMVFGGIKEQNQVEAIAMA